MNVHLDTHVAVWLAAGDQRRLKGAQARLRRGSLFVSPIVPVELEVLREIGRIRRLVAEVRDGRRSTVTDHRIARTTAACAEHIELALERRGVP